MHDSLLEGCYHEMGHVLATLHYFPDDNRIKGISFSKNPNGSFGYDTIYNQFKWSFPSQIEGLIMSCIGGGIFQQMKMFYRKNQSIDDGDLLNQIKCPFDGMEGDLAYLYGMYNMLIMRNMTSTTLSLEDEKRKAIKLLLPFMRCGKIDELCEYITNRILACNGTCDTLIEMKEINKYLMDESCMYYSIYKNRGL